MLWTFKEFLNGRFSEEEELNLKIPEGFDRIDQVLKLI
jgi:hypothetical protein